MYDVITPQQTFSQPNFKHWYKLYDAMTKEISDLYFMDDNSAAVAVNGKVVIVDPTKKDSFLTDSFEIYHVISK